MSIAGFDLVISNLPESERRAILLKAQILNERYKANCRAAVYIILGLTAAALLVIVVGP